jgi:hypothetical protein
MARTARRALLTLIALLLAPLATFASASEPMASSVHSLDGNEWRIVTDPKNEGREAKWFAAPRPKAKPAKVPWIIQEAFPGYHGVAWYWRDFLPPANPHAQGRYLLRFWAVDYLAEVWLNGVRVGGHEGGETPFVLDVTDAIKPNEKNRLAVRVLNPTNEPIDGIILAQTARRCKVVPFSAGAIFDHGGITDSVELLAVPPIRVEDLWVIARLEPKTGKIHVRVNVRNAGKEPRKGSLEITVSPASSGETFAVTLVHREFPAGDTPVEADLTLDNPHLWELSDPYLYRVTARVAVHGTNSLDECSTRCGFRDFRLADGYFRLNGRRIYLRCSHTCNHYPIGIQFPQDPDLLRRDLVNMKVMGFNAIRFIWGGATRVQLDLCDEIGLMVYEESFASNPIADSPKMIERFDTNVAELIRRDRNHPSIVMWGLLNESSGGPDFRHAITMLPLVRSLDDTRVVMLNSGRYDGSGTSGIAAVAGIRIWPKFSPTEPWVAINATTKTIRALGITWPPGQLAFHPGPKNEYSVVRWTAPATSTVQVSATFAGIAQRATTDVHVLYNGRPLFDALLNLKGAGNEARFAKGLAIAAGDTIDCVVGPGNEDYGADTTALAITIKSAAGKTYDATAEFSTECNPNGVWSYGQMAPGPAPKAATFALYPAAETRTGVVGSIANPGSAEWQDILSDRHVYPRVPHTADIIQSLRTLEGKEQPVFLSEYGIGSAVDLWRAVRHFEQRGAQRLEDAQFFNDKLNRFLADWQRWRLDEAFDRPEDFFMESLKKMASQRTLGLNAIRSNSNIIGHSLTGAIDHVMCGEGLTTLFRELKPGTIDALFDGWAPLRWCLFAEPVHVMRGSKVHLEAVLANEDVLATGEYPSRLQVVGPERNRILDRTITVKIPLSPKPSSAKGEAKRDREPPLAQLCFAGDVVVDGPAGRYRFLATFQQGAAAAGGETEFYLTDPAEMPAVETEIVLWGDDSVLAKWLTEHGIRTRPFIPAPSAAREVILASTKPAVPCGAEAFRELARRIACGATVVFIAPEVFAQGDRPVAWLPLTRKGTLSPIVGWLYLKDEWCKRHPIFEGMPSGGLMDYNYYREIIPDLVWSGQDPPAEAVAGAIKASQDYASGLMLAVYDLGEGRFILNTLRIRENLDHHPAAERLLRNLLRYAARDVKKPLGSLPADFEQQLKTMGF